MFHFLMIFWIPFKTFDSFSFAFRIVIFKLLHLKRKVETTENISILQRDTLKHG